MENHERQNPLDTTSEPGRLRRGVNYTSKKIYQALYKDERLLTRQLTTLLTKAYKESYKFFKYNPEILAIAEQHDAASFKRFLSTRSLNYIPMFGHLKQTIERGIQKQFISHRALPIKSLKGTSHLLGATFSAGSMYYGIQSGVDVFDRDFSDPNYIYAFLLFFAAKVGYYSLGEELHNEYSANWRDAQKRYHEREKIGLPRDPGLRKKSRESRKRKKLEKQDQ